LHLKIGTPTSKQYNNKATATWIPNKASEKYHWIFPASPSPHGLHTMDCK